MLICNFKFTILIVLSVKFYDISYSHIVVKPMLKCGIKFTTLQNSEKKMKVKFSRWKAGSLGRSSVNFILFLSSVISLLNLGYT